MSLSSSDSPAGSLARPRQAHPYLVLFALWLMIFSASSQVIIVAPILPEIGAAFGIGAFRQSTLVTAYAVFLSLSALVTGPISDRVGRRRILLVGAAFTAAALWLHGLATSYAALLGMRALTGIGGGMLSGGAVAYVGDYFPYERRGWANGWVMSGIAFGQVAGIPLGKILAALGYRWPFLLFAFSMTGAALLIWRYLPQPDVERSTDRLGVTHALRGYVRLLRREGVPAAVATYALMFLSLGLFVVLLPTWLETNVGISPGGIALLFTIGGAMNVLAGPAAGWFSDRVGRKPLIIASCLGFGAVMLSATFVVTGFTVAALLFALAMVLVAMRISPLQSLMTALVPGARRGALMSLAVGVGQIGFGAGSSAAGALYGRFGYLSNTVGGALAVFLMAFIVHRYLPEPDAALQRGDTDERGDPDAEKP